VKVVQALGKVTSELLQRWLWKFLILLDHLQKITTGAVLEDDPEVIARLVPVVEFEDVSVL